MAGAFVKNVGSGTVGNGTSIVVTVPAGGVALNNVVFVRHADSSLSSLPSGIVDTKSNTYTSVVSSAGNGSVRGSIWKATITTALVSGNTITVSFGSMGGHDVVVDEFSGITATADGTAAGVDGGSSTTPTESITNLTNATDLVLGHLAIATAGDTVTQPTGSAGGDTWHALTAGGSVAAGAYRITTSAVSQTYNPTISPADFWSDLMAAFQDNTVAATGRSPVLISNAAVQRASSW